MSQADDLLERGDVAYHDTEWLLLPCSSSLNFWVGSKVAQRCGLEWCPTFVPVNLLLNGDYKGSYWLVEAVKTGSTRVEVETDGFLIECDAYWWAAEVSFKTPRQIEQLKYTFKYPDEDIVNDGYLQQVSDYLTAFETALYEQQGDYTDYIDLSTTAGWLLTHDILGTWDSGGSNLFFYKKSMDANDKLKMGPVWDFDTIFEIVDGWARIHYDFAWHFPELLKQEAFCRTYKTLWENVGSDLYEEMAAQMDEYREEYGAALQMSWDLDEIRWEYVGMDLDDCIALANQWFERRVEWLHAAIVEIN